MANLNKVMLIGNAGKDAELRYTANGLATASFSLAVNSPRRNQQTNEWENETEWFNVVIFADQAERISQYVTKGKQVYVEGRFRTRSWDNDQGVKQYRTEVIANTIQLLGSRDEAGGGGGASGGGWNDQPERPRGNGGGYSGGAPRGGQGARPAGGNRGGFGGGAGPVDDIDDLPFE